ncbi:Protein CBG26538 [Caenorhabditis briggsae]|uniref:Protein CBG26538 n=1 Tax=Caenorhabditis briggsae TaxID=6238 RepID=B6IIW9_CAEBR|nr:Protein CBG26538 [Caenorhabditis briggsae]CAR99849.1 Protein CBG26538 [Caenorhabditis briggsae]
MKVTDNEGKRNRRSKRNLSYVTIRHKNWRDKE